MYSLILLSALAPGADPVTAPPPRPAMSAPMMAGDPVFGAPVVGCYGGCCGGIPMGCTGYATSYGCCGSSSGCCGCSGSCHGGMFSKHSGGLFGHKHSCNGGCYSTSSGCCGGCCGGWGSCSGSCYGCSGYSGGGTSWGPMIGMSPYTVPMNYTDSTAIYGHVTNMYPATPVATTPPADTFKPMPEPMKPMGASIKFKVPADTKIYVDGRLTALTGPERTFTTPPLVAGQKFYYVVKAELMVDGKAVVEEKRVIVESGADLTESFSKLMVAAESKTNPVAGK